MKAFAILALLSCALLNGCVASNLTELAKVMAQSTATDCATLTTIYGSGKIYHTNIQNGKVTCNNEGLSIESTPETANVPVTLTPVPNTRLR